MNPITRKFFQYRLRHWWRGITVADANLLYYPILIYMLVGLIKMKYLLLVNFHMFFVYLSPG